MKKIYFVIFSLFVSIALSSCRFEDEDYFDEPAALRIETVANKIQQTLVAAPNGWVMQYFTGIDEIEGFNLFARFENNQKVTVAGNHRYLRDGNANKYTEYASLYELLKEDGPVLAFNTWNDVLTPFVDPVDYESAPGSLIKDGEGMKGDHNFVVMSYGPDEVQLRGERHSARVRLVPCNYATWEEYIDATAKLKSYITNTTITNYYVIKETDTLYFKNVRSGVITYCERINDPLFPSTINSVFTPNGFRLHHQNEITGTKFQEFRVAADSTCLLSEDDSVRVIACWDTYVVNHTAQWKMDESLFTAEQKEICNQLNEAFKAYNANTSFAGISIGRSSGSNAVMGLVISFYTNAEKTKTNAVGLALDMTRPAFGQIKIVSKEDDAIDRNMTTISGRSENLLPLARSFAATLNGVYNMTPNNYFLPTGASYAPVNGGTAFTLSAQ